MANVVKSFVIETKGTVGVLQKSVSGKHRVVGLDHGGRDLGTGRDGKGKLGLASIVDRKTLQKKSPKTRTSASTSRVKDEEPLESGAVVGHLADTVQDGVNNLLSYGLV